MNWDGITWRLVDGRKYKSVDFGDYPHRPVQGTERCIVYLEDMQYYLVALLTKDEFDFPPIGPFPTVEVAAATLKLMS